MEEEESVKVCEARGGTRRPGVTEGEAARDSGEYRCAR